MYGVGAVCHVRARMLTLALMVLLSVDGGVDGGVAAPTGPLPSAFFKSVSDAAAVLEIEVPLVTTEKPTVRWERGVPRAKVVGLVASRAPLDAPETVSVQAWPVIRSCLFKMDGRKSVKAVLVLTGNPVRLGLLPLSTFGFGLESTPGYEAMKAAVVESFGWHEERMRAVGADQLWSAQRAALSSENVYLRHLAAEFLVQHDAGDVVDAAWGAVGTEEREKNEQRSRVAPDCK